MRVVNHSLFLRMVGESLTLALIDSRSIEDRVKEELFRCPMRKRKRKNPASLCDTDKERAQNQIQKS